MVRIEKTPIFSRKWAPRQKFGWNSASCRPPLTSAKGYLAHGRYFFSSRRSGDPLTRREYEEREGTADSYYRRYKDWRIPFHAELQYMRFPGGQIGAGRYYRASIRATNTLRKSREEWDWSWRIGYLSYHLGVGYGWKVGADKNVRLEGSFIRCQDGPCLQAAMTFGKWR